MRAGGDGRVYDEKERRPERVDGVSWRIYGSGVYSVFMDTSDEKEKHTRRERKERWEVEDKNTSMYFVGGVEADTGERGRTDKQTMFSVRKCNWWFVLEGMLPLWNAPALPSPVPPRLTPLPWLTPWAAPLTGGYFSRLSPGQAP